MKKFVINVSLVVVLMVIGASFSGCHGLGETKAEHADDLKRQKTLSNQMFNDDVDAITHQDRPTRLTEYTVR